MSPSSQDTSVPPFRKLALRPAEAAQMLSISERALWDLTCYGRIPCLKIGRSTLYPVDALQRWLNLAARHQATPPVKGSNPNAMLSKAAREATEPTANPSVSGTPSQVLRSGGSVARA